MKYPYYLNLNAIKNNMGIPYGKLKTLTNAYELLN